ncbi:MAG: alpha-L-fucosidase [Cellvibrio sp.]|uniref:alpha-L-fucosidase n=1 Tax=Cellvibrio sp. TaxID=1965322 RepID=UPI002722213C|nr:alpha-L-fucosidase [Cellvibrio sp.]
MKKLFVMGALLLSMVSSACFANTAPPKPFGPTPNENQMAWQEMEYYAFVHFGLNTYTDQPWGYGNEDINLFNPTELDARKWVRIMKDAGMKGVILTVKHHSGFALWPSKYTEYSVKNSPWKNGKGDLVREVSDACKEYGLKFGVYLSPWDRNRADYGTPEYITYFRNQLTELLTNYGPIFEVWFDGAHGGGGYYGGANESRMIDRATYYDWQNTYKLVRKLQPNIVIWNDGGVRADLRWVGTEGGWVGETNWSLLNAKGDVPWNMLHFGVENGDSWVPAEVNTSIRPEWFYHPSEDDRVKTVSQLMDTYYNSIGRNATLLLNFPIMPNGQIHKTDEKNVIEMARVVKDSFAVNLAEKAKKIEATNVRANNNLFGAANTVDGNKETYWATDDNQTTASLTIEFKKPTTFNRFLVQEYIRLGQRVKAFTLEAFVDNTWQEIAQGTTIGYKRILRFPSVSATKVRFNVTDSKSSLVISNIGLYDAPALLNAPQILRSQNGEVSIKSSDVGPYIYYTLDGSKPTPKSKKYTGPIPTDEKVEVRAITHDVSSKKSSPVAIEHFVISRKNWKISGEKDEKVSDVLDGNPSTHWYHPDAKKLPIDLVIDMGETLNLTGFKYLPHDDTMWNPGLITHYEFYVSLDNVEWKLVSQGEFSNIKNNPVTQVKSFDSEKARYIKLRALQNTSGNNRVGYAEIDVVTM